jgi:uncharacterized protein (TIGR02679 family)
MSRRMAPEALTDAMRELAGDADLRPLWEAVHTRLCAGSDPAQLATVTVTGMSAGGVAILRTWLDTSTRRRRGTSAVPSSAGVTRVPLRELLNRFGVVVESLPAIAELAVDRPVLNRSAARRAGKDARAALWSAIESDLKLVPGLAGRIQAAGVADDDIPSVARQARQIGSALTVIGRLRQPGVAPMTLAKLAHDCAHDPHGFDLDRLGGQRLVEAVAELLCEAVPTRPDAVRALLARAGVLADRLSSTVLVLNMSASGIGPVDERLRLGGGPLPLTLYDLTVHPPAFIAESSLLVVENPSVLEEAMAIGYTGAMACTSGHLRAVDHAFLQRVTDCRVTLSYAGDIDRDGLIIAGQIQALYGATLVAMNECVVANAGSCPSDMPLGVLPAGVPAELSALLSAHGRAVYQENDAVLQVLLT